MSRPDFGNRVRIERYRDRFERRFVKTNRGILYLSEDESVGVQVPNETAARLIADMRGSLVDTAERSLLSGSDAFFAAGFIILILIMLGAVLGLDATASALILPVVVCVVLVGPALSAFRMYMAFRHGTADAEQAMRGLPRVPAPMVRRRVPANHLRTALIVAVVMTFAVMAGLWIAGSTAPDYARAPFDRLLADVMLVAVPLIAVLAFAARGFDAVTRRRISEDEIDEAMFERRRRLD